MILSRIYIGCLALLVPMLAGAAPEPQRKAVDAVPVALINPACPATASLLIRNYPGAERIPTINFLHMPAGKALAAEGQKLLLTGRVLDVHCVPIADAQIELWQNDPYGRWILANGQDLVNVQPVFTGAGRTTTDNRGQFQFITLFPAAEGGRAPNINIKVHVPKWRDFSTVLYFEDDEHNMADPIFSHLPPHVQQTVSIHIDDSDAEMLAGQISIVMPYKVNYRGY